MDFASVVWWAYALTAVFAIAFGVAQGLLMRAAVLGNPPRRWLYAVKFALWTLVLILFAIFSLPLLVVFVAIASIVLIGYSALMYHKVQKGAR